MGLLMLIPTILCVLTAGYLAYNKSGNWGWFLLIAWLLMPSYKRVEINDNMTDTVIESIKALEEVSKENIRASSK